MKSSRILFVAVVLAAVGCAKPLPTQPPLSVAPLEMSENEWRVVNQIVVITDASGTMYMEKTFPEAKSLTRSFVAAMPSAGERAEHPGPYLAGTIGFGGKDRISAPLSTFDRASLASKSESLKIMGSLDGLGGTTPLHDVLTEVGGSLRPGGGPAGLVIFSDGIPDDAELTLDHAAQLVEQHTDGVCIYTVQTGADPEGTIFLRQLAAVSSCGGFYRSSDIGNSAAFTRFAHTVFAGAASLPPVGAAGPCQGVVQLQGVEFEFDRDEILKVSQQVLDEAVDHLKGCSDVSITIVGHTDGVGSAEYNQDLSERRAESTARYFIGAGIAAERLGTAGQGEGSPIAPNDSSEGRAQNRRVELQPR